MRRWTAGAVLAVAAAGCSASGPPPRWPGAPAEVTIRMTEFRLTYSPAVPAGRVVFRVVNAGKLPHSLLLFPEDEDAPPLDKQLHGTERRAVFPVAEVLNRAPGQRGIFAAQLTAGQRYGLMSPTVGAGDVPDFLKGMNSEFRAGAAPGPREATRG